MGPVEAGAEVARGGHHDPACAVDVAQGLMGRQRVPGSEGEAVFAGLGVGVPGRLLAHHQPTYRLERAELLRPDHRGVFDRHLSKIAAELHAQLPLGHGAGLGEERGHRLTLRIGFGRQLLPGQRDQCR